ncbi:MAG TPA: CHAT domain-containing protein, partial [Kofleriaceae bacterium]|nr:CHAT domain-containing protein [Kofleriaceae bacterium]
RNAIADGEGLAARRARLAAADAQVGPAARALAALVVAPVIARADRPRLAIAADGSLHQIPFAILPAAGARLGAAHELVAIPSAAVLAELRGRARATATGAIAILADPIYDAGDPRLTGGATPTPAPPDTIVLRGAALARLPYTAAEAEAIRALAPDRALVLTGADADRDALARADVLHARIVHVATHAIVDGVHLEGTGLALASRDAHGAPRDGFVRIPDIEALHLSADLVVLSACDTALGKPFRGEGLIGLVQAFHRAGAPRVLATLWQVDDRATAALIGAFYRHLLVEHDAPAAALAAAQAELAADPRFTAPYFWAGFVLHGDWR